MSILLITGPPAAGKNTIAEHLARRRPRCAVVDVEFVRDMVVTPKAEPWQGDDYHHHLHLGVKNACGLARGFAGAQLDVVILDVLTDDTLDHYRRELDGLDPTVLLLLPSEEEIASRLLSRPDYLSKGDVEWLYAQQAQFNRYDEKLDNSDLTPERAVDWILERWPKGGA